MGQLVVKLYLCLLHYGLTLTRHSCCNAIISFSRDMEPATLWVCMYMSGAMITTFHPRVQHPWDDCPVYLFQKTF